MTHELLELIIEVGVLEVISRLLTNNPIGGGLFSRLLVGYLPIV